MSSKRSLNGACPHSCHDGARAHLACHLAAVCMVNVHVERGQYRVCDADPAIISPASHTSLPVESVSRVNARRVWERCVCARVCDEEQVWAALQGEGILIALHRGHIAAP